MIELGLADVQQEADRQVARLSRLGVASGHSVGWLGLNGLEALGLLEACKRLDARFVPLNWRLSSVELAAIARHAGLQHLLCDSVMSELAQKIFALVRFPQPLAPGHLPGDCMVVYTSGTTGQPKGAVHTVAGMNANVEAAIEAQGLDADTRALAVLPMFHVGGLCIQLLPTLTAGGCVLLHDRFDASAWLQSVQAWHASTSLLVPATMQALLDHPDWLQSDLSSLQFVNCGSSVVPRSLIDAFFDRGITVTQVYGSTETGPVSIVLPLQHANRLRGKVGEPARGVSVRLLQSDGTDVTPGDVGEICLRAPNLMRCYHREDNHPSFREGWFHSGDLARQDPEGWYEVVGRSKDMIISGGENIYPAEIENCVLALPQVQECAVVGQPDLRWGEIVVLIVVAKVGLQLNDAHIRSHLQDHLARFKHPKRIEFMESLPRTALGKVQKEALLAMLNGVTPP